jgi:predicted RNA-binding protein with PIN domain
LRNLYGTYQVGMNARKNVLRATRAPPVLVVDGYNVLFSWERTKELMNCQEEGALEEAREILVASLEGYSIMNGVRVIVAFDALGGESNGITTETILEPSGITVVYTAECEADTWIVSKAKALVDKGARTIAVATNDATLAVAVDSPDGPQVCFTVPSSGLIADLAKTEKRAQAGFNSGAPVLALMESAVKTKDADRASDTFNKLQALRQDLLGKQS